MNRRDIINGLSRARGYKRYLEIGGGRGDTFDKIICKHKVGVDPETSGREGILKLTSDQYFEEHDDRFDIVFVDGLHHAAQAERDVRNAIKRLRPGGVVVMHDCNPVKEIIQRVPRETGEWTGDVWKALVSLRCEPWLDCICHDGDYGCGVVQVADNQDLLEMPGCMDWDGLEANRKRWLRLMNDKQTRRYLGI